MEISMYSLKNITEYMTNEIKKILKSNTQFNMFKNLLCFIL